MRPERNADQNESPQNQPVKVFAKDNIKFIEFDTLAFKVPVDVKITDENLYNGIYEWKSDSLIRRKFLILKHLAFLTTFEDLGRGIRSNLYVFDITGKFLIKDSSFERNYLHSSAGIFVVDYNNGKIFVIGKSEWYDSKREIITGASFYEINGRYFDFERNVYKDGELGVGTPSDTSIISFYKNAIAGKGVYALPDDWWRAK